jgi:5-methylcytosine-specific restriction enzyme A
MPRSTGRWVANSDDTSVPPRVRIRVFDAAAGRCQICLRQIGPADQWEVDHISALINGGGNDEDNLQCLCSWCHDEKSQGDVKEKSRSAKVRRRYLGIR